MVFPGLYRFSSTDVSLDNAVRGVLPLLPDDVAVSHTTALAWWGLTVRPMFPLHLSTAKAVRCRRPGIELHRFQSPLRSSFVRGVPLLSPARTFVDCGTLLSDRELVRVGDWMVHRGLASVPDLRAFTVMSHLDGVRRARRAVERVREGVESPRETDLRLALVDRGLPEPEVNTNIHADDGRFLARGDLVYRRQRVLVEYDGWHHERDAWQRQRDHLRREDLEAAGWTVIVVTSADMSDLDAVARRVRRALARPSFGR